MTVNTEEKSKKNVPWAPPGMVPTRMHWTQTRKLIHQVLGECEAMEINSIDGYDFSINLTAGEIHTHTQFLFKRYTSRPCQEKVNLAWQYKSSDRMSGPYFYGGTWYPIKYSLHNLMEAFIRCNRRLTGNAVEKLCERLVEYAQESEDPTRFKLKALRHYYRTMGK